MSDTNNEAQWIEIAKQLSCPNGENGISTAARMADNNSNMIAQTIAALALKDKERVLEIGPGGGSHVAEVIAQGDAIKYYGTDISPLMITEASGFNQALVKSGMATFNLGDGNTLAFVNEFFDKAFTVNTLYFWQDPEAYAKETFRVLKPGGVLCVAFALREFMEKLPFTKYTFRLYDLDEASSLFINAGYQIASANTHYETVKAMGETIDRQFIILTVQKM